MALNLKLILAAGALALSSCETVKPDDKLQTVLTGDIFGGGQSSPDEEKKLEKRARENQRIMPPKEEQKGVGLKMEF